MEQHTQPTPLHESRLDDEQNAARFLGLIFGEDPKISEMSPVQAAELGVELCFRYVETRRGLSQRRREATRAFLATAYMRQDDIQAAGREAGMVHPMMQVDQLAKNVRKYLVRETQETAGGFPLLTDDMVPPSDAAVLPSGSTFAAPETPEKPADLTHCQFSVLACVGCIGPGATISQVKDCVQISRGMTVAALQIFERDGLVERLEETNHGPIAVPYALTPEGKLWLPEDHTPPCVSYKANGRRPMDVVERPKLADAEALTKFGLSKRQFGVLACMSCIGPGATLGAISECTRIIQGTVSLSLEKLQRAGLCEKDGVEGTSRGRRSVQYKLTPAAQSMIPSGKSPFCRTWEFRGREKFDAELYREQGAILRHMDVLDDETQRQAARSYLMGFLDMGILGYNPEADSLGWGPAAARLSPVDRAALLCYSKLDRVVLGRQVPVQNVLRAYGLTKPQQLKNVVHGILDGMNATKG